MKIKKLKISWLICLALAVFGAFAIFDRCYAQEKEVITLPDGQQCYIINNLKDFFGIDVPEGVSFCCEFSVNDYKNLQPGKTYCFEKEGTEIRLKQVD